MRKFNYLSLILLLTFLIANPLNISAKEKDKKGNRGSLSKTAQGPAQSVLNINSMTCWIGSDGYHDWVVASSYNGAYPKGTGVGAVFAEGIVWGGRVDDGQTPVIRVNGNDYGSGCRSVFDEPRVYRVRPDFQTGNLTDDAASFFDKSLGSVSEGDINTIKAQYEADWIEWPADFGAPYLDADSNGIYEPDLNGNGIYGESGEDIPGIPAASQSVFIAYDDALSATLYQCPPIGFEVRETYWAYAYTGALANVIYKKVDLIYRGTPRSSPNSIITDFYFMQWCDPDVGTATDDFMGCDTSLNMGYAYNATAEDATYGGIGLAPAAIGYDYLQGVSQFTGNPNDSAIFNLQWRKGYKYVNAKPMSSAIYYAAGGDWSDPDYNYQGALEYYNYMQGLKPDGTPFPESVRDEIPGVGIYLLAGDPVAGTGKIDGPPNSSSGDRRLLVINGPVDIRLGDTAQVVIALVGGLGGADNLANVTNMKKNDATAQIVFDQLFQLPTLLPPNVTVVQLENKIILEWGSDQTSVQKIEDFSSQGYKFEGYNVYQLPNASATLSEGVLLNTFDLINGITTILDTVEEAGVLLPVITQRGTDKGIQRYFEITKDPFRGNQPLRNGQEYYFAVVPYAYRPDPLLPFHALQSAVVIAVGVPQSPNPGDVYSSVYGDTLTVTHDEGGSDGSVIPIIVDPTLTTGDQYKVTFSSDGTWSVTDITTGNVEISNQANQSGDEVYPVIKGVLTKVIGPPVQVNTYTFSPSADRWFTGVDAGLEVFFGGLGIGANFFGSNVTADQYVKVEIRFRSNPDGQKAYRYLRGGTPNYSYQDYAPQYFTVWDVDSNPERQLAVAYVEQNGVPAANSLWQPTADDADREYLFIFNTPYTEDPDPFYTGKSILGDAGDMPILYSMWPLLRGTHGFEAADGQVFSIIPNYANLPADVFTFTAPAPKTNNADLAKVDVEKINVFPNPYYGTHYRETSRDVKYVTFSHLPSRATIRIFDLAGVMVRTLHHSDSNPATNQRTTWDLKNNDNYPVASGIYIVHIDMPDLGATKVLKLAVVQEEQILKVY